MSLAKSEGTGGFSPEETVDIRSLQLDLLSEHERSYRRHMQAEDNWRTLRVGVWLTPFITGVVLEKMGHELSLTADLYAELGSVAAAIAGSFFADKKHLRSLEKGRQEGVKAARLVEDLAIGPPLWIEQALMVKEEEG